MSDYQKYKESHLKAQKNMMIRTGKRKENMIKKDGKNVKINIKN